MKEGIFERIIEIVDANIIFCLFPCILSLMLLNLIFKDKVMVQKALNIIRWFIIAYSIITVAHYLIRMIFHPEGYAFTNRATGPYWFAYWLMMICAVVLPFTLFIKKLASKYLYVLLVVFLMKSGFYFERFVIIATTIHRDYLPLNGDNSGLSALFIFGLALFLQGFILALLLLGIVEVIERSKSRLNVS